MTSEDRCRLTLFLALLVATAATLLRTFDSHPKAIATDRLYVIGGEYWDGTRMIANPGILIEDGKITRIGGLPVVNATGKFIVPGLVDAHVHLHHRLAQAGLEAEDVLPMYLQAGITTVRDIGDALEPQRRAKFLADRHPEKFPTVEMCSPFVDEKMDDGKLNHPDDSVQIRPEDVPEFARNMKQARVRTIKLYGGLRRPVGRALIAEAHEHGLAVAGHLDRYGVEDAVNDGIDTIEHTLPIIDQIARWEHALWPHARGPAGLAEIDLKSERAQGLFDLMAARGTMVDPTLIVMRNCDLLPDGPEVDFTGAPPRLQSHWREWQANRPMPWPYADREAEWRKHVELVGELRRHGVLLLVGTDSPEYGCIPGRSFHDECELLHQAGLTPTEILKAATENNAAALHLQGQVGQIAPGARGDLVIVNGNPARDISELRNVEGVVHRGKIAWEKTTAKH